ncbi:hypothetical protein QQ045_002324 [Rhodiola kirilowii]
MFKSARWRIDRNRNQIKSVFRLYFRVTQVPVLVGEALLISVVPKDVGKPTSRLEKAAVKDGTCCWENPVYETVKFVRDSKTGKFSERVYCFVVSTGNQKSNVVGEVSIDFAEYAESIKPSSVSLPFQNPQCAGVLHVTIQRIQEHTELRGAMECEDVKVKLEEKGLETSFSDVGFDEKTVSNSVPDTPLARNSNDNVESNGNHRISSESDLLSSSGCSSELNTPRELALIIHQGHISPKSSLNFDSLTHKQMTKALTLPNQELQQQQWEWSAGFDGVNTDDSTITSQDSLEKQRCFSAADVEIEKLRNDLVVLGRHAEFSGLELQTLRKQIVKESKRGNELTRELISVREERDAFKAECEDLKAMRKRIDEANVRNRGIRDPLVLIEELRQELQSEKDLNSHLRLQLQKTQESNSELLLAVQDLDEMLEQKNKDMPDLLKKSPRCECDIAPVTPRCISKCCIQEDEEQKALEDLVNRHNDVEDSSILEQKVIDLYNEMNICRRDRDEMEMQMEQLALDYEILKQENHDIAHKLEQSQLQEQLKMQYECSYMSINELEGQIESLENQLRKHEQQYSESMTKISELQTEVIYLEEKLEKLAQEFESDLEAVTRSKIEQEQRAILAEEALRATKLRNANAAERLQEDFKRLSMQMASTFDANEKLAMKSINEAAELRLEKNRIENLLNKTTEELYSLKKDYEEKLDGLSNLSQELPMLRAEVKRLTEVNDAISTERDMLKTELGLANSSTDAAGLLLIGRNVELSELEDKIAVITEKADKSMEELAVTKSVLYEKEGVLKNLVLELENLERQNSILKHTSLGDESENEHLQKQVLQLKRDIEKKEKALSLAEKKLKGINGSSTLTNGTNTEYCEANKEAANLMESIRVLQGQIKLKENFLETTTNSFLEKEKDLLDKVKELERRDEELRQNTLCLSDCQKINENICNVTSNSNLDGLEMSMSTSDQSNLNTMMSEMEKLKELNISMEMELNELQERYSEISLKFAEVEGERQELVMSLRYLKNSRKI